MTSADLDAETEPEPEPERRAPRTLRYHSTSGARPMSVGHVIDQNWK